MDTQGNTPDLLNIGLPKWPAMIVRGQPVTVDQAKEIIRRTDSSFCTGLFGNDREFNRWLAKTIGLPQGALWESTTGDIKDYIGDLERFGAWRKLWGCVEDLEYVHNNWIACSFIGGPHGWCHPDGVIEYHDNIGKWPSVQDVLRDWTAIAQAFPFIELTATLMDRECCEDGGVPLVTIRVKSGTADLCPPEPTVAVRCEFDLARLGVLLSDRRGREFGLPLEWVDEWAALNRELQAKTSNKPIDPARMSGLDLGDNR